MGMNPDRHFAELMERAAKHNKFRDLLERIAAKLRVAWALHALTKRTMRDDAEQLEADTQTERFDRLTKRDD